MLAACSVDRLPLVAAELVIDGGYDAEVLDQDASDAATQVEAGDDATFDGAIADADVDASDSAVIEDAGNDAQEPIDAFVPTPRYVGPCKTDHDCERDETCVRTAGLLASYSYCAQTCASHADCDTTPLGAGQARCSGNRCRLPCDAVIGSGCPSTMECQDFLLILPADDGTCSFLE